MLFGAALVASGFVNYVYFLVLPDTYHQAESVFQLSVSLFALIIMVYGFYVIRESQTCPREKAECRTLLGGLLASLGLALYIILMSG
jgi:hypothetical protein